MGRKRISRSMSCAPRRAFSGVLAAVFVGLWGCGPANDPPPDPPQAAPALDERANAPLAAPASRQALFGDLHVHTQFSYDAFLFGTRTTPDDAYRFAKGMPIEHPAGFTLELARPLDFQGVSDHGNYLGVLPAMFDPESPAYDHPAAPDVRAVQTLADRGRAFRAIQPYVRIMKDQPVDDHLDVGVVRSAWSEVIAAANRHYEPGSFTTFIAYEYTSAGRGEIYNNLHRNVVFRGAEGPIAPFSRLDSFNPEDLWDAMDAWREAGMDAIAIPHNMNGSGGRMFEYTTFEGDAMDATYIAQRRRNEPIVEITQTKGTSETHPMLSPNDEWADFEIMPYRISTNILSEPPGSYVRDALRRGLTIAAGELDNPYEVGIIGSSDTHVSAGSFTESDFFGTLAQSEPTGRGSVAFDPETAPGTSVDDGSARRFAPGAAILNGASGLAAVWAEHNTRESIFDAMRRRETFATSGTRLRLRFFAGDVGDVDLDDPALVESAYASGVPMGGSLPATAEAPALLAWAMRDDRSAPLDRLQIVKGWIADGETHERVFDVACSDDRPIDPTTHRCAATLATVDLATCAIQADIGSDELKASWRDPTYEPNQASFYYVRVLENPTCRWSTFDALRAGVEPRRDVPTTIQERAWSSPIWVRP